MNNNSKNSDIYNQQQRTSYDKTFIFLYVSFINFNNTNNGFNKLNYFVNKTFKTIITKIINLCLQ